MQLPTVQYRAYIQSTSDFNWDLCTRPPPKQISRLGTSSDCMIKVIKLLHDVPELNINRFAAYHPHYKEKSKITEFTYNPFLLQPPPKLVSLPGVSSDCIVKVIAIYHPHYKEKLEITDSTKELVTNSVNFAFACDGSGCADRPDLVPKKGEPLRTFIYLLSHRLQSLSLLFNLTLSEMRPVISEYTAMSKYAAMSKWQFSSTLASFPLLADYSSIKLTSEEAIKETKIMTKDCGNLTPTQHLPEASFDLSCTAQKVKFTADINTVQLVVFTKSSFTAINDLSSQISYVICLADTTSKAKIMHWCNQVTRSVQAVELYAMAHGLDIKKRHWRRYQIMRKKSHQHKHYGMGGMGKHK